MTNLTKKEKTKILADKLISTLGNMSARQADKVVKEVATRMYVDILGKKGEIKGGQKMLIDYYTGPSHYTNDFKFVEKK